jgi:hypothetical protein
VKRAGAALVLALLVLLVLEGVVLGTVYLAVQERRIADNGITTLRLRLAAEAAARAAAAVWPVALDSLPGALSPEVRSAGAGGVVLRTVYQRIDSTLVLAFAEAAEPPPRAGRARASLLLQPPLLSEQRIPPAALIAGAAVKLGDGAQLAAASETACASETNPAPDALRLPAHDLLVRAPGVAIVGTTTIAPFAPDWTTLIARLAAVSPPRSPHVAGGSAVIAVAGDLTIPANTAVRGLVLVTGTLVVEAGAIIDGIVLAAGPIEVNGTIRFSACAARDAVHAAGLHRPRAYPLRASVPAF